MKSTYIYTQLPVLFSHTDLQRLPAGNYTKENTFSWYHKGKYTNLYPFYSSILARATAYL